MKRIFVGNSDSSSIVKNFFSTPLSVKALRIYPQSWNNETALRIAVYTNRMLLLTYYPMIILSFEVSSVVSNAKQRYNMSIHKDWRFDFSVNVTVEDTITVQMQ